MAPQIGQRARLNGKDVVWSGPYLQWQSTATYNKIKDSLQPNPPLLRSIWKTLSKDALQVIQDHLNPSTTKNITTRGSATSGVQSTTALRKDPNLRTTLPFTGRRGRPVRTQSGGGTTHSYNVHEFGQPNNFNQPRNLTPQQQELRSAASKDLLARTLENIKPGESIGGRPLDKIRARLFRQQTNGVMETQSNGNVNTPYRGNVPGVGNHIWETSKGDIGFNPKDLKRPLANLAVRMSSRLAGPYAQAAALIDDVIGGATGTRPSQAIKDQHIKTTSKAIEERLRKGERFINPGLQF